MQKEITETKNDTPETFQSRFENNQRNSLKREEREKEEEKRIDILEKEFDKIYPLLEYKIREYRKLTYKYNAKIYISNRINLIFVILTAVFSAVFSSNVLLFISFLLLFRIVLVEAQMDAFADGVLTGLGHARPDQYSEDKRVLKMKQRNNYYSKFIKSFDGDIKYFETQIKTYKNDRNYQRNFDKEWRIKSD